MRLLAAAAVSGLLVLAGLQPATAATTPSQVGMVSFTNKSYNRTTLKTSLSLDWSDTRGAKKYQVFMSRSYSMSNAKTYSTSSSSIRVNDLTRGTDYFFQVRGVNGSRTGTKSKRVGHTTIRRQGHNSGPGYRVMTYNVCSAVCDDDTTTSYGWAKRQPAAFERIRAYSPEVVAAQEASRMDTPPGYTKAIEFSAKVLWFKSSRFDVAPAEIPQPRAPEPTSAGCTPTYEVGRPTGSIFLGRHAKGCRYAVWAELVDKSTSTDPAERRRVLFVSVHAVAGSGSTRADQRRAEMYALFHHLKQVNTKGLPVVIAGDFNSHKNHTDDSVATVMRGQGYYDAYDLARSLYRQHYNSYNGFETRPRISYTWGDHVDHVWAVPGTSRVDRWRNGVLLKDNRLVQPIPSDHSPIVVDLRVN